MRIGAVLRAVALIVLAGLAMPAASAGAGASESTPGSFGGAHARAHVAASAPYRFENTILRLHFDVARGVVYGHETVVVRPKYAALRSLPFHSEGITYRSMLLDGRPLGGSPAARIFLAAAAASYATRRNSTARSRGE